jgi:hypothetical protein
MSDFSDPESQVVAKPPRYSNVRASRIALGLALILGMLGCRSSTDPTKTEILNLAGTWSGTYGTDSTVGTLTQDGSTISGKMGLWTGISGTLSGSIEGSVLTLTINAPAGTYTPYGVATCSMTATERFVVSATSIKKTFTEHWTPDCVPLVIPVATRGNQVTLTKQ